MQCGETFSFEIIETKYLIGHILIVANRCDTVDIPISKIIRIKIQ